VDWRITDAIVPALVAVAGFVLIGVWVGTSDTEPLELRVPGLDRPASVDGDTAPTREPPSAGQPVAGPGTPSEVTGSWPWFRGPQRDGISREEIALNRNWPESGPPVLWSLSMGEGYAGAAIADGCAYVLDYDEAAQADTLRCLSLDDGHEIWRNSYPVEMIANHGISRTTPAIVEGHVITIGPRCHVACWDSRTGECQWLIDLELEYGAEVPRWYTGQCPLIDGGRLILAPGGKALVMAVDIESGEPIWQTPNPLGWKMTHVSIVPAQWGDRRMYIYCSTDGVVGVSADDGALLWQTTEWIEQFAIAPSPVVLPEGRVFLSSGYDKKLGSMMLQVRPGPSGFAVETLFKLRDRQFNSEQQTPIYYDGYLFGVRKHGSGKLVCLDLEGNEIWNSGRDVFGHGPYMIADGTILVMSNHGRLVMAEASTQAYRPLASHQVFEDGFDAWGPMALVGGRLILRDMTRMTCLDLNVAP
jgi:outer membrane protein assembly factor BamB